MIHIALHLIHFIVGSVLLAMAIRSYFKTRISSMLYFILGFFFLTVGHTISDIYFFDDRLMYTVILEVFDILGLLALLIGVIRFD